MTEWQVKRNGNIEDNLIDVAVTEREAPYPDSATAFIADFNGTRRDQYQRGTLVEFESREFDSGNSFSTELTTIAVKPRGRDEGDTNVLEVTCHDVDALLRGNDVKRDLSGQSLSDALNELVTNDTPVAYNASKVDVQNNVQVTRSFRNERVDNVLQIFSQLSGGEVWGVDDSLEFFFRPPETSTLSQSIASGDVFSYDLPERGESSINEARVFYDDGNSVVIIDDGADKQRLQDQLGTASPVTLSQPIMLENVTKKNNARQQGRKQLRERSPVLIGTASTVAYSWLLDAQPGDTVDLTIQDAGLSAEVRIASLEYRWSEDRVDVTFVETGEPTKGYEDDFQVAIQDTLKRVEMRPATDAQEKDNVDDKSREIRTTVRGKLIIAGAVDSDTPFDTSTVTNDGFIQLRDGWINSTVWGCDEIAVGTGTSDASRADTSLQSESESVSVSTTTNSGNVVEFSPSSNFTTGNDITEIGLKDTSAGELLARATLDEPVTGPSDATFSITVIDDPDTTETVLTDTGQTASRDILADNSPTYSSKYAVGSGTTAVDTSDTSLDTQEDTRAIGNEIVAAADDATTFGDVVSIADDTPAAIQNGNIELTQTAFVENGPDIIPAAYSVTTTSDTAYNDGSAATLQASAGDVLRFTFTTNHRIPAGNLTFAVRGKSTDSYTVEALLYPENETFEGIQFTLGTSIEWHNGANWTFSTGLDPGEHTFEIRGESARGASAQDMDFDVVALYDDRYHSVSSFDNTLNSNSGYLDSPALFPNQIELTFDDVDLAEAVDSATIDSTWNDTSDSQFLKINGNQADNTSSTTQTGLSGTQLLTVKIGLSNYGSRSGETPLKNHKGQTLQDYRLSAGTDGLRIVDATALQVRSDIPADVVNGVDLAESGTEDSNGTLQTRCRFAAVTIEQDTTVINRETIRFGPATRDVNASDFDPTIVSSSDENTSGSNLQIRINDTEVQ